MKKILSLALILLFSNCSQIIKKTETLIEPKAKFLFVQKGTTASFDGKTLTIHRVPDQTLYFSDRPFRLLGHVTNKEFFERWDKTNNPNAALSYFRKDLVPETAVLELSNPKIGKRNSVSYRVKVLSGKIPHIITEISLFIDDMGLTGI